MCSWTAKRKNKQCVTLYERLSEKGKPEKVIKVAITHKLVRQIFGERVKANASKLSVTN
jgi:transposase